MGGGVKTDGAKVGLTAMAVRGEEDAIRVTDSGIGGVAICKNSLQNFVDQSLWLDSRL